MLVRRLDRRPVQFVYEIPVKIHVIEFAARDGFENHIGRRMRGKSDEPHAPFALQLPCGGQCAVFLQGPVQELAVVDSMQRQQVHVLQPKVFERGLERVEKFLRGGPRRHFGLDDDFVARQRRQDVAKLHFRCAVAAGGFDMIDAKLHGAVDGGLEVLLIFAGNVLRVHVLPLELVAHAPAGNHGHGQSSPAKATVFHGRTITPEPRFRQGGSEDSNVMILNRIPTAVAADVSPRQLIAVESSSD